eukprot:Plantae.Rhodophyta-Rhodochaete_pulchella.ctg13411.p1 GENE.Plantae.Rhodophyta-Rhodochaete_pulchella.ctg13411~~Plantae.Rhodophyta-Rhodochaete_pulchella.ctg13411.p1  ORF type:complete len:221 (+),score=21.56 Plantae.Rhodophyta-Rhodochaete_pulchella.ctg13411:90-752(+)
MSSDRNCALAAFAVPCGASWTQPAATRRQQSVRALHARPRRPSPLRVVAQDNSVADAKSVDAKALSEHGAAAATVLDSVAIMDILPHRYPFLLIDKVVGYVPGKSAVGIKNVTANEPQFTGHFPGRPIMPGVLMVEAMAQVGGIVVLQPPVAEEKAREFFFAGVDGVKFRKPVVPGDTLVMEMELTTFKKRFGIAKMTGRAYVDGELAVEVDSFLFAMKT